MSARSLFRGLFWSFVAITLVFHAAAGWHFSGELIQDVFVPDPTPVVVPGGDFQLVEVRYDTPLGEMDAWHLPSSGSVWVIHVHGKGASPDEAQHLFAPIQQAGFPQLAITYRNDEGQPQDPSGYYQYGATEWQDIAGAMDYAEANGATGVVFSGLGTGASHILSFLFRHNFDSVKGLIFDSPNVDMGETVAFGDSMRDVPIVPIKAPLTLTWVSKFITSLRIGVNWKAIDYVERADSSLRIPVLVHHGSGDLTVPVEQARQLDAASPDLVDLVVVDGADHVGSYDADPQKYVDSVLSFLQQVG